MAKQTVKLKKYADIINEYVAAGAITPGHFVVLASTGKVGVGAAVAKMVALEDELRGKTIDDAYAADEPVQCWNAIPGEEAYCILDISQTIAIGDLLEVAASGEVTAVSAGTAVCQALEAVTTTASPARIKVRFI